MSSVLSSSPVSTSHILDGVPSLLRRSVECSLHANNEKRCSNTLAAEDREKNVSKIIKKLVHSKEKGELKHIAKEVPKGGELHLHMMGALYWDEILNLAIEEGLHFDTQELIFCKAEIKGKTVPAEEIKHDARLETIYKNALSLRGQDVGHKTGHDHFMTKCFTTVLSFANLVDQIKLVKIVRNYAESQRLSYIELMVGVQRLKALAPHLEKLKEEKDKPRVNFICEMNRKEDNMEVFKQELEEAIDLMQEHPDDIVGISWVGSESSIKSSDNFDAQMKIINKLWNESAFKFNCNLHAGELKQDSRQEIMDNRIGASIEEGHAKRVGHGVCINSQRERNRILDLMRERGIALEANPVSNRKLLGVKYEDHPLRTYLKRYVPITINSDDPAMLGDLNHNYYKTLYKIRLTWDQVKDAIRNSLEYSFLNDQGIFVEKTKQFIPAFQGLDEECWVPNEEAKTLLRESVKVRLQVALERSLVEFEKKIIEDNPDLLQENIS